MKYRPNLEVLEDRLAPANIVWKGNPNYPLSSTWNNPANWYGGAVPGTGDIAVFDGTAQSGCQVIQLETCAALWCKAGWAGGGNFLTLSGANLHLVSTVTTSTITGASPIKEVGGGTLYFDGNTCEMDGGYVTCPVMVRAGGSMTWDSGTFTNTVFVGDNSTQATMALDETSGGVLENGGGQLFAYGGSTITLSATPANGHLPGPTTLNTAKISTANGSIVVASGSQWTVAEGGIVVTLGGLLSVKADVSISGYCSGLGDNKLDSIYESILSTVDVYASSITCSYACNFNNAFNTFNLRSESDSKISAPHGGVTFGGTINLGEDFPYYWDGQLEILTGTSVVFGPNSTWNLMVAGGFDLNALHVQAMTVDGGNVTVAQGARMVVNDYYHAPPTSGTWYYGFWWHPSGYTRTGTWMVSGNGFVGAWGSNDFIVTST